MFYHRRLKCLVAIELKKGKFKPEYAGKMNFYLNLLDEKVREELREKDYPYVFSKPDLSVTECLSNSHCWNWKNMHRQLSSDLLNR